MNPETKNCQNCKQDFIIEPDDFSFYEKIKVPPPTFCPECRMKRRMIWRNARSLHRRECGLCKKIIISMYSQVEVPVYCTECFNSDAWDPYSYTEQYDFSKPFFPQLKKLFNTSPRLYRYSFGTLVNSDFTNYSKDNKNVYLSYSVIGCEDVMYSEVIDFSRNTFDCYSVEKLDGCSNSVDCEGNYNTHYAVKSQTCIDSYFIYDCVNCQNCCLSWNQRNQQYVFMNQKLSKEAYIEAVANLNLETRSGLDNTQKIFDEIIKHHVIHKYAFNYSNVNVTGDYIHNSRDVKYSFEVTDAENVAYSVRTLDRAKDSYDCQGIAFNAELIYESVAASINTYKDFFTYICLGSKETEYSFNCRNCSNVFGCVSLTGASYCIFNKQYSKEEYFETVNKIKQQMMEIPYVDQKGRVYKYGEFFPYDMCPFGFNESNSHDAFPLPKEEALSLGYPWKDRDKRDYAITLDSNDIPNNITDINDGICEMNIGCPNGGDQTYRCTMAFRIMPNELQFYKQKNLPLPRYCPNCRHYERLKYRNPMHLYKRVCSNGCGREFETTYAPDRPEKVYCEQCYQQEVL